MKLLALLSTTLLLFLLTLYVGSVSIPAEAVTQILLGGDVEGHASWSYIVWQSRLPQAATAVLCGMSLSAAGLMLQTAFRNALAGPSIMGIDSGANLGVALVVLAAGGVVSAAGITIGGFVLVIAAALTGAMAVMLLLLLLNSVLRSDVMLLIAGIMISYLTSSVISLLNFRATEEGVHSFVLWGMGSFAGVSLDRLPWFAGIALTGLIAAGLMVKPLNTLLLGDNYARNLGLNIRRTRTLLLITTGILTAASTAFCGPITFLGLAVPHIARLLFRTADHRVLMPATMLCGAALALACSLLCTLPGHSSVLPINVVTPVIGAPVVLYVILKRKY